MVAAVAGSPFGQELDSLVKFIRYLPFRNNKNILETFSISIADEDVKILEGSEELYFVQDEQEIAFWNQTNKVKCESALNIFSGIAQFSLSSG